MSEHHAPAPTEAPPSPVPPSPFTLAAAATLAIRRTLTLTRGNIRAASALLGLSPSALHRRLSRDPATQAWHRATFPLSTRQPSTHAKRPR